MFPALAKYYSVFNIYESIFYKLCKFVTRFAICHSVFDLFHWKLCSLFSFMFQNRFMFFLAEWFSIIVYIVYSLFIHHFTGILAVAFVDHRHQSFTQHSSINIWEHMIKPYPLIK